MNGVRKPRRNGLSYSSMLRQRETSYYGRTRKNSCEIQRRKTYFKEGKLVAVSMSGKNLFRNTSWVFISSLVASGFTFLTHIFLARNLTIASYGAVNVLMESLSTVIMLADMGTTVALINLLVKYKKNSQHEEAAFLVKAIAVLKLLIGSLSSFIVLGYLIFAGRVAVGLWLLVTLFGCACLEALYQNWLALFQCREEHFKLAIYRVVLPALRLIAVALLALTGTITLYNALLLYSLSVIVTLGVMYFRSANRGRLVRGFLETTYQSTVVLDIKDVARWTSLSSLMVVLVMKMDIFLLVSLSNSTEIGVFSTAQKYAAIGTVISSALSVVLMPRAAHVTDKASLNEYVRSALQTAMLFAAPVLVLAALANHLLVHFFGQQYHSSVVVAQWLTVSFALGLLVNPLSYVFYNLGYAKYLTYMNVSQFVLAFATSFMMVPTLGALGSSMSNFVTRVFGAAFILLVFVFKIKRRLV